MKKINTNKLNKPSAMEPDTPASKTSKATTIMEDDEFEIDSNIDDNLSDRVQRDYDFIGIKEVDSPYQEAAKKILQNFYNKSGDKKSNAAEAFTMQSLFAIDSQVYTRNDPAESIFIIANDVVIMMYKQTKQMVINPFKMEVISNLLLAENVPSACAFDVNEETEKKIGRSHIIMESPSMGLFMRYVLEREYEIELDFTDSVPIRQGNQDIDFCFMDLNTRREMEA